jgi:hypothetical protein
MFSDAGFDWPQQHQAETSKHQRAKSAHSSFPGRLDLIGILGEPAEDLKTWRQGQRIGSEILSKSLKEDRKTAGPQSNRGVKENGFIFQPLCAPRVPAKQSSVPREQKAGIAGRANIFGFSMIHSSDEKIFRRICANQSTEPPKKNKNKYMLVIQQTPPHRIVSAGTGGSPLSKGRACSLAETKRDISDSTAPIAITMQPALK